MSYAAKAVSLLFNPLLVLLYMTLFLLWSNPYTFGYSGVQKGMLLILFVFFTSVFIPLIAIVMMRALQLIPSLKMPDKRDRILPLLATGIFYLWLFQNVVSNPDVPLALSVGALGVLIGLFLAFMVNIFQKISIHTVGAGAWLAFITILMIFFNSEPLDIHLLGNHIEFSMIWIWVGSCILAGAIGTSQLILKNSEISELNMGYFIGFTTQWMAFFILN